jgi:hypothetical protein
MSRELRRLIDLRDERMLEAFQAGRPSIFDDLLFSGEKANPVSVRSLVENYFLPSLEHAGLDGSGSTICGPRLAVWRIQGGAPLPYVRDQMGHSSIQITADKYVHLISGRNVGFVDQLDTPATPEQSATQAQPEADDKKKARRKISRKLLEIKPGAKGGSRTPMGFPARS